MSQFGSWSVKGVDDRARAMAKEKARLKGVTLGDYINNLLLEGHSEAGPRDFPHYPPRHSGFHDVPTHHQPSPLDNLAQRIEAVEARSTLAITGIDQSVLGLLARLEGTENASSAMAADVEAMIDELRETHETLHEKVGALEHDDSAKQSLEAMKALEDALGKLASHVYEESRLTQDETMAVKGRVEAGFSDLNDRVEGMEVKVESTLAGAAQRVEKAVEQAELRAEGTSRHLSERFSAIESSVAAKLSKVDDVDARMSSVEGDVSGAITSMESTLGRIQERLSRAETTTDTALKALEQTFASLDERIEDVAVMANPERSEALRQELEQQFEALATDLRASVEHSRQHLANEIEQAAAGNNPELMGELESRINSLESQNTAEHVEGIATQISDLSGTLDQRIVDSERRSAAAIEQVGDQVASAIKHVQARQEKGQQALEEKIEAVEERGATRLSEALCNVSDRLTEMQNQTASSVSPVQRAIVSLASRLEAIEDFNAPPHAQTEIEPLPEMPDLETDFAPLEAEAPVEMEADPVSTADEPEASFFEPETVTPDSQMDADEENYDFIAGLPDFDEGPDVGTDDTVIDDSVIETVVDEDEFTAPTSESVEDHFAGADDEPSFDPLEIETASPSEPDETDPLAELGSWDDAQQETRDSDIFSADEEDEDLSVIVPGIPEDQLAHNLDEEIDEAAEENLLEPDDEATDYLSRARKAAIAASQAPGADNRRRSATTKTPKAPGNSRKFPVIAAASVFAIAAAGAGGWVALRGKLDTGGPAGPSIATKSSIAEATTTAETEPTLGGVEFAETAAPIDETLFDEEGSVSGLPAEGEAELATVEVPLDLPVVPKAMTLERAAIAGDPVAQFQWGQSRLEQQDYAAGADFVRRAARQGVPAAQYRLAKLHERGIGVPRDFTEARNWVEKAANGGNIKAMHDLAVFYADGEGGPQSYAAAAEWFRKAADYGVVDSQFNLAVLYENGLGISPSQTEALYWYEIAAANGDASAPGNVTTLREALPLEQAQQAQRRASNWSISPIVPAANGRFGAQSWERSERAQVLAMQTVLNGLGYEAGTPDGLAGAATRAAIESYQAANGLEPNGTIDELLIETMNRQTQGLAG